MTTEKLKEAVQAKENIDYLTQIIERIDMFGVSLETPVKEVFYKENGGTKKGSAEYDNEPIVTNEVFKILERSQKAKLKALRQYRTKLQGKLNKL